MKVAGISLAAALILVGFLWHEARLVVAGAVIHLFYGIVDLYLVYRDAKLLRAGTLEAEPERGVACGVGRWTERAITLTGLVLVCVTKGDDTTGYAVAGWIIWGGAIFCYFLSGIIAREVGGIPLSIGYGGWRVRRSRNGRYWR
jgi:hypothetical protein